MEVRAREAWLVVLLLHVCKAAKEVRPEEVVVNAGERFEINCTLPEESAYSLDMLYFTLAPAASAPVDPATITSVVDKRTKQLRVEKAGLSWDNIHAYCYARPDKAKSATWLGAAVIHVGEPPLPIRGFECVSPNWESMLCTWNCTRLPGHAGWGDHRVNYQLNYTLNNGRSWAPCPKFTIREPDQRCQCSIDDFSGNFIRYDPYQFSVRAWSAFGEVSGQYEADPRQIVRPYPVGGLSVYNVTATEVTVSWTSPRHLEFSIFPLTYQLRLHSYLYNHTKLVSRRDCEDWCSAVVTDLQPHTDYTVSVRSRSKQFPSYWSAWSVENTRTLQTVPARGPEMESGAFLADISDDSSLSSGSLTRDIDLYFKDVPHEYLRGELEDMRVTVTDLSTNTTTSSSCQKTMKLRYCKILGLSCSDEYRVRLDPSTAEGFGDPDNSSTFSLARCGMGPPRVQHFVGEIWESDMEESTIRFTWRQPVEAANLTLYYCSSTDCKAGLEWVVVPEDETSLNLTVEHPRRSINDYKFSVSATRDGASRGLPGWLTCLYDWDGEPGLPDLKAGVDELQAPDSLLVEMVAPECQKGSGRVLNYWLHYALASDPDSGNNVTIVLDAYTQSHRLTDLWPHTEYLISLTAVGRDGRQKQVPAISMTTAPPAPLSAEVVAVIVVVCFMTVLILACLLCRLYHHLRETPIEIKLPIDDLERKPEVPVRPEEGLSRADVEEELLHDLMCETRLQLGDLEGYDSVRDDTTVKLLPNGVLGQARSAKQRSRDSGNGSLLSDALNHDHVPNHMPNHVPNHVSNHVSNHVPAALLEEDGPQFVQGPDDYVLQVHVPTAYDNQRYTGGGEASPLSSEPASPGSDSPASPGSDSLASSSQDSTDTKPGAGYWAAPVPPGADPGSRAGSTPPAHDRTVHTALVTDDNGNTTPVNQARDSRDNGYGSTTPNDASLTNCEDDSDSASQYSLDSGHSVNSATKGRTFSPLTDLVMTGDYVMRPDMDQSADHEERFSGAVHEERFSGPVKGERSRAGDNSCGETDAETDNSTDGRDSDRASPPAASRPDPSPPALHSPHTNPALHSPHTNNTLLDATKPFKPVTLKTVVA